MKFRSQRGTSMVETMLVMTLLLTVLCGVMEAGRALYTYHAVANAARLGARYAIVRGSSCAVTGCPATTATVRDYVRGQTLYVDSSNLAVNTTWPGNTGCTDAGKNGPGCLVVVRVQYTFNWSIPFVPLPSLPMTSTSQMLISQ
jgi:Flp pilus assembly protein TadG